MIPEECFCIQELVQFVVMNLFMLYSYYQVTLPYLIYNSNFKLGIALLTSCYVT